MKIKFIGATREVTGSKHMIITDSGKKILLDCGMFQGKGMETDAANRDLGFEPSEIDYVLVSHAHIDHTGLIPYIYKNGLSYEPVARWESHVLVPEYLKQHTKYLISINTFS